MGRLLDALTKLADQPLPSPVAVVPFTPDEMAEVDARRPFLSIETARDEPRAELLPVATEAVGMLDNTVQPDRSPTETAQLDIPAAVLADVSVSELLLTFEPAAEPSLAAADVSGSIVEPALAGEITDCLCGQPARELDFFVKDESPDEVADEVGEAVDPQETPAENPAVSAAAQGTASRPFAASADDVASMSSQDVVESSPSPTADLEGAAAFGDQAAEEPTADVEPVVDPCEGSTGAGVVRTPVRTAEASLVEPPVEKRTEALSSPDRQEEPAEQAVESPPAVETARPGDAPAGVLATEPSLIEEATRHEGSPAADGVDESAVADQADSEVEPPDVSNVADAPPDEDPPSSPTEDQLVSPAEVRSSGPVETPESDANDQADDASSEDPDREVDDEVSIPLSTPVMRFEIPEPTTAYRELAVTLSRSVTSQGAAVAIGRVSPEVGCGMETLRLAGTVAEQLQREVLVVDASGDPRPFPEMQPCTLADLADGDCELRSVIWPTTDDRIQCLPLATDDAGVDVISKSLLVAHLRRQFSLILLDMGCTSRPPAVPLAQQCDAVVIAVTLGFTLRLEAETEIRRLQRQQIRDIACVLTTAC